MYSRKDAKLAKVGVLGIAFLCALASWRDESLIEFRFLGNVKIKL
jgi:hypothetical protein